jgi:fructokinase
MSAIHPVLVGGEALYDLISKSPGSGLAGTSTFEKRPGGSPFNIAVGIARLGVPVSFVGKFGNDQFGQGLIDFLKREGIAVEHTLKKPGTKTTLAFVAVDRAGKVDFEFYQDNAADISFAKNEVPNIDPKKFSILHCGGIVMAREPSATAYMSIADRFLDADVPVSLDPTIRKSLISDEKSYLALLRRLIAKVTILKVSDEELLYLAQKTDLDEAVASLPLRSGALVILTLGKDGALIFSGGRRLVQVPGFKVEVVETTGCGDSFMAATLAQLAGKSNKEIALMSPAELEPVARCANAAAAIVATRYGAADANPTRAEVEAFMTAHQ